MMILSTTIPASALWNLQTDNPCVSGAFLIPFFIMLLILGLPVFYLELAIGQRLRKGAIGVWNQVSPYAGGIGIASCFVSLSVGLYYNTIIAWCLYYLFHVSRTLWVMLVRCVCLPRGWHCVELKGICPHRLVFDGVTLRSAFICEEYVLWMIFVYDYVVKYQILCYSRHHAAHRLRSCMKITSRF